MTDENIYQLQWKIFMTRQVRKQQEEDRKRFRGDKFQAEDERGWSGQHGQRPGSDEERNYRPNQAADAEVTDHH